MGWDCGDRLPSAAEARKGSAVQRMLRRAIRSSCMGGRGDGGLLGDRFGALRAGWCRSWAPTVRCCEHGPRNSATSMNQGLTLAHERGERVRRNVPRCLEHIRSRARIKPSDVITHRFPLEEIGEAISHVHEQARRAASSRWCCRPRPLARSRRALRRRHIATVSALRGRHGIPDVGIFIHGPVEATGAGWARPSRLSRARRTLDSSSSDRFRARGSDLDPARSVAGVPRDKAPEKSGPTFLYTAFDAAARRPHRIHKSTEHARLTPVFGTGCPPTGIGGKMRDAAYKYSEGRFERWLTLLAADRINVVEDVFSDLAQLRVPNVFDEMGLRSEWRHNRNGVVTAAAIAVLSVAALTLR